PVGHVYAPIWTDHHVVRLIELPVGVARLACDTEAQKLLALRAELVDLVPLGPGRVPSEIRNPDVALTIDGDAMRRDHHALAEIRQDRPGAAVELEDRIEDVGIAGRARPPPPGRPAGPPRRGRPPGSPRGPPQQ